MFLSVGSGGFVGLALKIVRKILHPLKLGNVDPSLVSYSEANTCKVSSTKSPSKYLSGALFIDHFLGYHRCMDYT